MPKHALVASLRVSSPDVVDWLADTLELEITERTPTENGTGLAHVELWHGEQCLMAATTGMADLSPGVSSLYLAFEDEAVVHRLFARAEAAGAPVVMPPTPMDYGGINATIRDPDGNYWSLGTFMPARA